MRDKYDAIVIGGGLGGLTAAKRLGEAGLSVLLVEQHSQIGGLAAFFRRRNHIFDVALHGFPVGMKKSFRKYWGKAFADRVIQLRSIRFDNPQFQLETTFDRQDFTRILTQKFKVPAAAVAAFFQRVAETNFYDDHALSTRRLFERFFPGRSDVWRFLMEPITYANGSTLNDPGVSYAIVFGNFMSRGVYTFQGGTDLLMSMMRRELRRVGVDVETHCLAERILVEKGKVRAVIVNGRTVAARAVVSNGSLVKTVHELVGDDHFDPEFLEQFNRIRVSNSSCQVYIGIKPGEKLPDIGELIFSSVHPEFDAAAICSAAVTSRSFSVYYPFIRPGSDQSAVVASMNARYQDWQNLDPQAYEQAKKRLIEQALDAFEKYVPHIRRIMDWTEAATPRTFERYTHHVDGASFGTKFDALPFSMNLARRIPGLFHTGSTAIIMSGWLGAANYGVITAHEAEKYLTA
ncbi:MAG: NAD(P)/FAD-dependent oxidoreductase [Kiritimatiellaeota bacterium]|nr:NAD(P)/FAD-dependent oxidoreductase [Kiritimatiellota bacterium]